MEQVNAVVDCDVARLNIPLRPWFARTGHGFVALLRRVPADVTQVCARVYTSETEYEEVAAQEHADGSWQVRCPADLFPAAGELRYEVFGTASDDEPCALGEGRLCVQAFGPQEEPEPPHPL